MTVVGRAKLDHPSLGTSGGAGLHSSIETMWTSVSDHLGSRYKAYASQANSSTVTYEHNFGVDFSDLSVILYTGSHPNLTRVSDPAAAGWTIVANGVDPKTKVDVTAPSTGGPHNFVVYVVQGDFGPDFGSQNIVTTGQMAIPTVDDSAVFKIGSGKILTVNSGSTAYGFLSDPTFDGTATAAHLFRANGNTADNWNPSRWIGFVADSPTLGTNSTIEQVEGFRARPLSTGNVNIGFYSELGSSSASATISSIERTSNVVTVNTTAAHGFLVNQRVYVKCNGSAGSPFTATTLNGGFTIASVPSSTSFTYASTGSDVVNTLDSGTCITIARYNIFATGSGPNHFTGRATFGTTASVPTDLVSGKTASVEIVSTSATVDSLYLNRFTTSITGTNSLVFNTSRGSNAVPTALASGGSIGQIRFQAANGKDYQPAANILSLLDDTPSDTSMPGRLDLQTTPAGSNAPVSRMEVRSSGNLRINVNAQSGINLSTTSTAKMYIGAGTYTDTVTAASGTVSHGTMVAIDDAAIAASNSSVTYTNASTLYIHGAPTNGTNVTITNPYAMYVAAGKSYFGGATALLGNTTIGNETVYSAAVAGTTTTPRFSINGTSLATTTTGIMHWNSGGAYLSFNSSAGGSIGTHAAVGSSQSLGVVQMNGSDGTSFIRAVQIEASADGTVSTGVVPGKLQIYTAKSTGAATEAIRIDSTQATRFYGFKVLDKSTLTIASGAVTATKSYHLIAGEGGVADSLATINGGVDGAMLTIRASSDTVDITVDETGNIALSTATFVLDSAQDTLTLIYDSGLSKWLEVARSNNN